MPLERFGSRSPFRLSGGEARRLSLAVRPRARPAACSSSTNRHSDRTAATYEALLAILDRHLDAGATLIAATHDRRLVADVADRVVTLAGGRIVADERVA